MKISPILFLATLAVGLAAFNGANDTALLQLPGAVRADSDCATFCRFRLCVLGSSGDFIPLPTGFGLTFPPAFTAEPPFICTPSGPIIGRILRTREAMVRIRSGRYIRIVRLGRNSLRARFNRNFFAARELTLPDFFGLSAVRRSKFRSMDQRTVLENRCVFLPIRTWEVMTPAGMVARIVTSSSRRNCVSFISTATTTQMKITLMWNTAADLDLSLTEPEDGFKIAFEENKSPNGGFLFEDVTLGDCDANDGERDSVEMIEYSGLGMPPTGTYQIELGQFASCDDLDTDWYLTVTIGDTTVVDKHGTVAPLGDDPEVFKTLSFTFPDGDLIHEES